MAPVKQTNSWGPPYHCGNNGRNGRHNDDKIRLETALHHRYEVVFLLHGGDPVILVDPLTP